jgi:hypothetical protein
MIGCVVLGVVLERKWTAPTSTRAPEGSRSEPIRRDQLEMAKLALGAAALQRSSERPAAASERHTVSAAPAQTPPREVTAAEERDAHVARLEVSGSAPPEFLTSLHDVSKEWRALVRAEHLDVDMPPWRCFKAGCYSTMSFRGGANIDLLNSRLSESKSFYDWPGGKFRSGPIPSAKGTEVTWVFFAPEPRQPSTDQAQSSITQPETQR